ncbi:MAG TPA: hypothetical protein VH934_08365 [Xanthobacteraceae bacterium]|jgi:hypothetical protein
MIIDAAVAALAVAFLSLVALGHLLLVAAICKCVRSDDVGGRGRRVTARPAWQAGGPRPLPAQWSSNRDTRRARAARPACSGAVIALFPHSPPRPELLP